MSSGRHVEAHRQRDVLTLVVKQGPAGRRLVELEDLHGPFDGEAMDRLIAEGLLVREGERIVPTRAATRFYELTSLLGPSG